MTPLSLFRLKPSPGAALPWKGFGRGLAYLAAIVLASSAFAQTIPNIAGTYRGLMTRCLTATQSSACRQGLTEIVRLADEVDGKQAVWSRATGGDDRTETDRTHREYSLALDRLNQSVDAFNRDMAGPASEAR